jgi:serine/threonine protein phosphatase PrpC
LNGSFTADSPEGRAARYRLNRYAGHPAEPEPDLLNVALRSGDLFLLCTDGISDQVGYERLTQVLGATTSLTAAVAVLLNDSLLIGDDNATAALVRVV